MRKFRFKPRSSYENKLCRQNGPPRLDVSLGGFACNTVPCNRTSTRSHGEPACVRRLPVCASSTATVHGWWIRLGSRTLDGQLTDGRSTADAELPFGAAVVW